MELITERSKRRTGSGTQGIGIVAAPDRGGTGLGDRDVSRKNLSSIPYRLCQSAQTTLNFFRHLKWPFSK
jgi:hypothetical protein